MIGHAGIDQTLPVMHQHLLWRGIKADIASYIENCDSRQRSKLITLDLPEMQAPAFMVPCGMFMWIWLGLLRHVSPVLQFVNCFIFLAIFDANVKQIWLTISSAIVLFSFVFASSMRILYLNVMFLLATHPYDVGDQVQLDNGDTLTVDRMSILTTQFIKGDNSRTYIPNERLAQQSITNLTRLEKKDDSFRVFLDLNTPAETFTELQEMVQRFMSDNPQDYRGVHCTGHSFPGSVEAAAVHELVILSCSVRGQEDR